MKKFLVIISLLIVCILTFSACSSVKVDFNKELLDNGTFENNSFAGWTLVANSGETVAPSLKPVAKGSDSALESLGDYFASITSTTNTAYEQKVKIEKDSIYQLSALVRVNSTINAKDTALSGAFVGISTDYDLFSERVTSVTNGWKEVSIFFNSKNRGEVTIAFGVGTASYNATGTAQFDNISLKKIESAPTGVLVKNLSNSSATSEYTFSYRTNSEGVLYLTLVTVLGAMVLFGGYIALRRLMASKHAFLTPDMENATVSFWKSATFFLIIAELVGFAIRLILVNFVYGGSTMSNMVRGASQLADLGAATYYGKNTVTTPIGSLYILWVLGLLANPLGLVAGGSGYAIFLKIPAIIADMFTIFLIFYYANRKYNQYISLLFACVYAVCPIFFFASAGWGVYASIGVLFLLLALVKILDRKYAWSVVLYSLATMFSTEVLLVLPLLLVYLGYVFFKNDDYKLQISISISASIIVLYLIALPFTYSYFTSGRPFVAVARYCQAFLLNKGFTNNAFTIYGFFGLGASTVNTIATTFSVIFVVLALVFTLICFFSSKSRLDLILLSAFTFVATFVLTSAVDLWLIYFALALLFLYGIIAGERRVLKIFGGFAITATVNTAYAMMIGGYFGNGFNSALVNMSASDPVLIIFSIFNLGLFVYLAYVVTSICIYDECKGVVIIEENYFKYFVKRFMSFAKSVDSFFKKLFKKNGVKNVSEDK